MKYVVNSAVITAFGVWLYKPLSVEQATEWLQAGGWLSTVRYNETAQVIQELTGVEVPLNDQVIAMDPGDEALVFRLRFEKGASRVARELKGKLTKEFVREYLEIGLLKMLGRQGT